MSTPRRAVKRTPAAAAAPKFSRKEYANRFVQFISNKNQITLLTTRNDGDKKKEIPGIKTTLVEDAKAHGDRDPETGSYFLEFDSPIEDDLGVKWSGFKAERRASKVLDVDKAREMLEEKDLLSDVEKHVVTLVMDAEVAAEIAQYLADNGLADIVSDSSVALSEDELLQAHYRDKKAFTEEELDSLYETKETWAAVPQKA